MKRQYQQQENNDDVVDDLLVAAQYAAAVAPPPLAPTDDADEISLSSSSAEIVAAPTGTTTTPEQPSKDPGGVNRTDPPPEAKEDQDDDDVDDESDDGVDRATELGRMLEDTNTIQNSHVLPLTANEIDPYHTNRLDELQETLRFQVVSTRDDDKEEGMWEVAGTVHHHMVDERTLVVLSKFGTSSLLEEGSALSLRKQDFATLQPQERVPPYMVLGSILEVFGPVSRPLYSVRLFANEVSDSAKEIDGNDETKCTPVASETKDPWSQDGEYTKALKEVPTANVYFLTNTTTNGTAQTTTRFIDTHAIYQNSGRGCDASNVYDEEVLHPSEMDFSDDEKERAAKSNNRKGRRSRQQQQQPGPRTGGHGAHPQGFHCSSSSRAPSAIAYSPTPLPAGRHPAPVVVAPTPPSLQQHQQLPSHSASPVAPDVEDEGSDTEYYAFD